MVHADTRLTGATPVMLFGFFLFSVLFASIWLGLVGFKIALMIGALFPGGAWMILCVRRPLLAFSIVFIVFVFAYQRLGVPMFAVEGHGNRGAAALGDILWLGLLIAWIIHWTVGGKAIEVRVVYPSCVWAMLPFILFAVVLPIMGVLTGDWPLSYSTPGLRQIQWSSFAAITYLLANKYGTSVVLQRVLGVVVFASVGHLFYALIQLGFALGILGRGWIIFDDLFAAQHVSTWFYYPRLTGLLVNPNSYGVYSAFVFVIAMAMKLKSVPGRNLLWLSALVSALFGLASSSSRSAMVGLFVAFLVWAFLAAADHRLAGRALVLAGVSTVIGVVAFAVSRPILPKILQQRFGNFFAVFTQGAGADANFLDRVERWRMLLYGCWFDFPLGTWVPPSYATGSAIDSYYVATALQGTPAFTLVWLLFLGSVITLGLKVYRRSHVPLQAAAGLVLAGWAGAMAGAGFTLSPMLQPQLIVPFWALIGITLAMIMPWNNRETGEQ